MADIWADIQSIREVEVSPGGSLDAHFTTKQPFVVRNYVSDWPLVKAGQSSANAARDYLLKHSVEQPFVVSIGGESEGGRLFYRDDMQMNTRTGRASLPEIFDRIDRVETDAELPIIYLASIDIKTYFNGLHEANHVTLGDRDLLPSIWIGLKTRIAAHNDHPDNLACVAVGRRRFTLFPPGEFRNLYLGPVDNTPAGRAVSMVDFYNPDFGAYPKFRDALKQAVSVELAPGDALYIPSLWWHHVEGLDPFNVLVNYWWRDTPRFLGQPQTALNHAMMSIRDLPADERAYWRDLFDYYVFEAGDAVTDHIPESAHSILGPMTAEQASKIRTFLLKALNQ